MTGDSNGRRLAVNATVTVFGFGLSPFFQKLAIERGVTAWSVALATVVFAAMAALAVVLWRDRGTLACLVAPRARGFLLLLGVLSTGLVTLLVSQALTTTTATNRGLFQSATPAATLLFAHFLLRERLARDQYVAIAVVMVGLLLVNGGGDGFRPGIGFWLLCATLPLIGLGDVLSKRLTRDLSPLALTVGRSVYGALFLVLFTPFLGLEGVGGPVEWFALAAAGLLQGVGVWTLYRAMQGGKASLVAALVAAAPLATLSAESAFLGLDLAPVQWIGLGIVLAAAGWLAVGEGRR